MLNANRDEYKGKTYASQQAHQDICKGKKKDGDEKEGKQDAAYRESMKKHGQKSTTYRSRAPISRTFAVVHYSV